jgi:hypothetical protein
MGCGPMGLVWRENEEGDYDASCARCEIIVSMDAAEHVIVNGLLDDDRRSTGSLGRAFCKMLASVTCNC